MCFLVTVRPTKPYGTKFDRRRPFIEQVGLVYVRGCEIQGMLDDKGRVIEDGMMIYIFERVYIHDKFLFLYPFCTLGNIFSCFIY